VRAESFFVAGERSLELGALAAPQPIAASLVTDDRLSLDVEREYPIVCHSNLSRERRGARRIPVRFGALAAHPRNQCLIGLIL